MSIEAESERLRSLTDDFYHGLLDWDGYRRQRGELLDALLQDEVVVVQAEPVDDEDAAGEQTTRRNHGFEPDDADNAALEEEAEETVVAAVAPDPLVEADAPADAKGFERTVSEASPERQYLSYIGAGAALLLAVLVWALWPTDDPIEVRQTSGGSIVEVSPASALLGEFVAAARWDDGAVSGFMARWDELSVEQREDVRGTERFRVFLGAVRDRIHVEQAIGAEPFQDGLTVAEALAVELDLGLIDPETVEAARLAATLAEAREDPANGTSVADSSAAEPAEQDPSPLAQPDLAAVAQALALAEQKEAEATAEPAMPEATTELATPEAPSAAAPEPAAVSAPIPPRARAPVETAPPAVREEEKVATAPLHRSDQPCTADRLNFRSARCWDMIAENVRAPMMRVLPAGTFTMGEDGDPRATPVREQSVAEPIAIGVFEVTVAEFDMFCSDLGRVCPERRESNDRFPMVDVTWEDASAYAEWLSLQTGARYRLPTEVEWEYAARAGSTTRYPFGDKIRPTDARYDTRRGLGPLPADDKTMPRNGFDLMHTVGNVREWTSDAWRADYSSQPQAGQKVVRGGSFGDAPEKLRSAAREGASVSHAGPRTGFRVVREL